MTAFRDYLYQPMGRYGSMVHELANLPGAEDRVAGLASNALGLDSLGKQAAEIINTKGWVQGSLRDTRGAVCLVGALQEATEATAHPTDWSVVRAVFAAEGRHEGWNDENGRAADDVVEALSENPLTDDRMAAALGPQWLELVALNRTLGALDATEAQRLGESVPDGALNGRDDFCEALRRVSAQSEPPYDPATVGGRPSLWLRVHDMVRCTERHMIEQAEKLPSTSRRDQVDGIRALVASVFGTAALGLALRDRMELGVLSLTDLSVRYSNPFETRGVLSPVAYARLTEGYRTRIGPLHPDDDPEYLRYCTSLSECGGLIWNGPRTPSMQERARVRDRQAQADQRLYGAMFAPMKLNAESFADFAKHAESFADFTKP